MKVWKNITVSGSGSGSGSGSVCYSEAVILVKLRYAKKASNKSAADKKAQCTHKLSRNSTNNEKKRLTQGKIYHSTSNCNSRSA
jgi:hypothetical protein